MTKPEQFGLPTARDVAELKDLMLQMLDKMDGATIKPAPEWLRIPDAAKALGCSTDTIRRRINSGEMKARGSGRLREVRVDV